MLARDFVSRQRSVRISRDFHGFAIFGKEYEFREFRNLRRRPKNGSWCDFEDWFLFYSTNLKVFHKLKGGMKKKTRSGWFWIIFWRIIFIFFKNVDHNDIYFMLCARYRFYWKSTYLFGQLYFTGWSHNSYVRKFFEYSGQYCGKLDWCLQHQDSIHVQ